MDMSTIVSNFLGISTQSEKEETKKCLVFWLDEGKTSIVDLIDVVNENEREEGKTTQVAWRWKGKRKTSSYPARILKIESK